LVTLIKRFLAAICYDLFLKKRFLQNFIPLFYRLISYSVRTIFTNYIQLKIICYIIHPYYQIAGMGKIKILITDGTDIVRYGLKSILERAVNFEVIAIAENGKTACKLFAKHKPDVSIVSSNIPDLNIHEVMDKFRKIEKNARVMVLTNSADFLHLNQALKAGVTGYIVKNISGDELISAVRSVAKGEQAFSSSVSKMITKRYSDLAQKKEDQKSSQKITKRENEILQLIVDGYTSPEIAKILFISPRTVETHRSNLMAKLNVKNTAGLVRFALEKGDNN